jgi:ribonuclease III
VPVISLRRFFQIFRLQSSEDKELARAIQQIMGKLPNNLSLYKLALSHSSLSKFNPQTGKRESNERLEYLGDAVLGVVVADYLFKKYPFEDEGFLTEIRSRIVNRESLNQVARKIGLDELIFFEGRNSGRNTFKSMNGDALEAFVGAVYLERGFHFCYQFVLNKIIRGHFDLNEVISTNKNFKSLIIEWAQRESKDLKFELIEEKGSKHRKEFIVQLYVDAEPFAIGKGLNKKKAEQAAAEKALERLKNE